LPAASSFIECYRPDFLVEAHLENDGPVNVPRLEKFFAQFGYEMTCHSPAMKLLRRSTFGRGTEIL
jgi:hypothetical protein